MNTLVLNALLMSSVIFFGSCHKGTPDRIDKPSVQTLPPISSPNPPTSPVVLPADQIDMSRQDLLNNKRAQLESIIDNNLSGLQKYTFEMALKQYPKVINGHEHEKIQVLRNDASNDQAATDLIIDKLHEIDLRTTKDWMHYHLKQWNEANAIVSYLDYANASLGGGAFGHGWVQEEQMVAFCTEFALLLAGHTGAELSKVENINYITRSTREPDKLSPRPKYLRNLRCGTGTKLGVSNWSTPDKLENNDFPPAINIIAAATVNLRDEGPYELLDVLDLFSNIYRAFELVKKTNGTQKNVIFGGRIGAGVFGQSVSMSAAMQILAAKILGIDHLVLTAAQGQDPLVNNIYKIAEDKVIDFLKRNNVVGQKIEDVLSAFLAEVKDDPKWQKNSKYR